MTRNVLLAGVLLAAVSGLVRAQEKKDASPEATKMEPKADAKAPAVKMEKRDGAAHADQGGWLSRVRPMSWERFSMVFVIALLVLIVALLLMIRSDLERYHKDSGSRLPGGS